jgi:hypothetical protein
MSLGLAVVVFFGLQSFSYLLQKKRKEKKGDFTCTKLK